MTAVIPVVRLKADTTGSRGETGPLSRPFVVSGFPPPLALNGMRAPARLAKAPLREGGSRTIRETTDMTSRFDTSTLGEIVAADYRAAAVLDRFGLDFCCGGKRTLDEACASKGVAASAARAALDTRDAPATDEKVPDASWAPDELTRYIERRHHTYVRVQSPIIATRLAKLVSAHGERHPELRAIAAHFDQVAADLQMHMMKEEQILFPYVRALVAAREQHLPAPPNVFGTVRNPIRMMEAEHQSAGSELGIIRELTKDYSAPEDGCTTYRVGFAELAAFDRDLRMHIHLENNVLFPKAVALEERAVMLRV